MRSIFSITELSSFSSARTPAFSKQNVSVVSNRGASAGHFRGDCVGVGVEHRAVAVVGEWCDYGHESGVDEAGDCLGVDFVDIADVAVVDFAGRALVGADYVHVGASESDGVNSGGLKGCDDVFVDESAVDHCHDAEGVDVGDASAVDHFLLDAEL